MSEQLYKSEKHHYVDLSLLPDLDEFGWNNPVRLLPKTSVADGKRMIRKILKEVSSCNCSDNGEVHSI